LDNAPTPEIEFDRTWAREILTKAKERTRDVYRTQGKSETFRVLAAQLEGDGSSCSYQEAASALGCSVGNARYIAFKLRETFRNEVSNIIRDTVTSEEELAEELSYLQKVFERT